MHWPFCAAKCPYCDFNSHVPDRVDMAAWRRALLAELSQWCDRIEAAGGVLRPFDSVFFGGGTPSLMDPGIASALLDAAASRPGLAAAAEITLEANPASADTDRLAEFRGAGIGRLSLGVQSLDDGALRALGRVHDRAQALAAIELGHRLFDRLSFDLIYARPGQSLDDWRRELDLALALAGEHISLYQLTIEEQTPFHAARRRGELVELDGEAAVAQWELAQERLCASGRPAYEVSNHARPGAECRHNLVYWRSGDWIGIGPGAHGRLQLGPARVATRQHRAPEIWLARSLAAGHATQEERALSVTEQRDELLLMGLRLSEGVPLARLAVLDPQALVSDPARQPLRGLIEHGLLRIDGEGAAARLATTPDGRLRLNGVLARLI